MALSIFKENVMGSGVFMPYLVLRGFENIPLALFPYSHFFFILTFLCSEF